MIGRLVMGRYRVEELVGTGGMSLVYRAKDIKTGRYVAVKFLRDEFSKDEEFLRRFAREAKAVESMAHPNIVALIDAGEEDGKHCLIMEYVDGITLKELITEKGRVPEHEAVAIATCVCRALSHAHARQIVHRDIKPQNILINSEGVVKVADFGIARALNAETMTSTDAGVMGSVHYFSPEQARGGLTDEKSDLYSLGVVLYDMVVGHVPFDGETPVTIALAHIQEAPRRPRRFYADISPALEDIILKAMEKDKTWRYDSAKAMEADLMRAVKQPEGGFVQKRPPLMEGGTTRVGMMAIQREEPQTNRIVVTTDKVVRVATLTLISVAIAFLAFMVTSQVRSIIYDEVVPAVVGMPSSEGVRHLQVLGFEPVLEEDYDDNVDEGLIIKQVPESDTKVRRNTKVVVVKSLGRQNASAPNLLDRPRAEAEREIVSKGFLVGEVKEQTNSPKAKGTVVAQEPGAGDTLKRGSKIDITVSNPPEVAIAPQLVGRSLDEAQLLLSKQSIKPDVFYGVASDHPDKTVFAQQPEAGELIDKDKTPSVSVTRVGYRKIYVAQLQLEKDNAHVVITLRDGQVDTVIHDYSYPAGKRDIELNLETQTSGEKLLTVKVNDKETIKESILFQEVKSN